jgi:beta-N-acetylhexosaminidase
MRLMIRISLILLCPVLASGSASALPKLSAEDQVPLLVLADDDDPSNVWKPTEEDCRRFSSWATDADCARYRRPPPVREKPKQEPAPVQAKGPQPPQPPGPAHPSKKAAVRPQTEPERNAAAPKPLAPASASAPIRPMPAKTPDERLKYMVGQLVLTGFSGRQPDEPDVERIIREVRDGKVSGVIVRNSNVAGFQQLRRLLSAVANAGGENPPLLATDQPGGPDTVLSEEKGFAFYGSASSVSSSSTAYEAQLLYRAMAGELAALGVNFNIGPSEDACREDGINLSAFCFGAMPSRIGAFARAFNFGHHDRGVLTALRHVPLRSGLRTSWTNERASSAILHLLVKGETSDALVVRVKAMEPIALTGIAYAPGQKKGGAPRGRRFGFDGTLIFELDIGPGGTPIRYEEAILRAFQAGADMILVRESASIPAGVYNVSLDAVRAGIKSGRLPMARIVEAYKHVQRLKARLRASPSRTKVAGLDQPEAARARGAR